uniref:Uncharacterized protein n=1 Tax=Arundo donax TaxID=35708 RepID=A0A0A9CNW8_ARUDO
MTKTSQQAKYQLDLFLVELFHVFFVVISLISPQIFCRRLLSCPC